MNRTLHLPLKKEWYNMIESGAKTEEYRLTSCHWIVRLFEKTDGKRITRSEALKYAFCPKAIVQMIISDKWRPRKYDYPRSPYKYEYTPITPPPLILFTTHPKKL